MSNGFAAAVKSQIICKRSFSVTVEELNIPTPRDSVEPSKQPEPSDSGLFIVPAVGEGDEVVGQILARLLEGEGISSNLLSWRTLRTEKVERLRESKARYIVLSAIESRSATTVVQMARSIQISVVDRSPHPTSTGVPSILTAFGLTNSVGRGRLLALFSTWASRTPGRPARARPSNGSHPCRPQTS